MSNITIYHPLLDQDVELRTNTEEIFSIIQRGQSEAVALSMALAKQHELINDKSRKKDKGQLQALTCELFGMKRATYFDHVKAGKVYIAEPGKRNLSRNAVLGLDKPKQLRAPKPKHDKAITEIFQELNEKLMEKELEELRGRVKALEAEVEFLKEERDDLRGWLDNNTRSRAAGVYNTLKRQMLH